MWVERDRREYNRKMGTAGGGEQQNDFPEAVMTRLTPGE